MNLSRTKYRKDIQILDLVRQAMLLGLLSWLSNR